MYCFFSSDFFNFLFSIFFLYRINVTLTMISIVKKVVQLITERCLIKLPVAQSDNHEKNNRIIVGAYNLQIHIIIDLKK